MGVGASVVVGGVFLTVVTLLFITLITVGTRRRMIHGFGMCIGNRITCAISTGSVSDTGFRVRVVPRSRGNVRGKRRCISLNLPDKLL